MSNFQTLFKSCQRLYSKSCCNYGRVYKITLHIHTYLGFRHHYWQWPIPWAFMAKGVHSASSQRHYIAIEHRLRQLLMTNTHALSMQQHAADLMSFQDSLVSTNGHHTCTPKSCWCQRLHYTLTLHQLFSLKSRIMLEKSYTVSCLMTLQLPQGFSRAQTYLPLGHLGHAP